MSMTKTSETPEGFYYHVIMVTDRAPVRLQSLRTGASAQEVCDTLVATRNYRSVEVVPASPINGYQGLPFQRGDRACWELNIDALHAEALEAPEHLHYRNVLHEQRASFRAQDHAEAIRENRRRMHAALAARYPVAPIEGTRGRALGTGDPHSPAFGITRS